MALIFFLYFLFGLANAIILFDRKDTGLEVLLLVFFWPLVFVAVFSDILADILVAFKRFFTDELE